MHSSSWTAEIVFRMVDDVWMNIFMCYAEKTVHPRADEEINEEFDSMLSQIAEVHTEAGLPFEAEGAGTAIGL